jgi:hypothetical protein
MNPTIFEDWLRYMESFSIEIRLSLEISQERWKIVGKNRDKLQRSGEYNGKMLKKNLGDLRISAKVNGKFLERFPTNF